MRIDASGNLLVGKSGTAFGTAGVELRSTGGIWSTVTNGGSDFNRLGDDGAIQTFWKDGATVGSIGTYSGDFWIGQGNTGLLFNDGSDVLRPANASGGNRDGIYDLGDSDSRFKDLYLSGGVRGTSTIDITIPETSGGAIQLEFGNNVNDTRRTVRAYKDNFEPAAADTGVISLGQAANKWKDLYLSGDITSSRFSTDGDGIKMEAGKGIKFSGYASGNVLDDYESGTWTPEIYYQNATDMAAATNVIQAGTYTKVGNIVNVSFRLEWTAGTGLSTDNIGVKNLPFTGAANHYNSVGTFFGTFSGTESVSIGNIAAGGTLALVLDTRNTGNLGPNFGTGTGRYIRGSMTYLAA